MEWVRMETRGEKSPKNLTTDWSNGITLCTLIDAIEPGLCPRCDLMQPDRPLENVKKAIRILENNLEVDRFLDADAIVVGESAFALSYLLSRLKIISEERNLRRAVKKPLIQVTDEMGFSKPVKLTDGECFAKGMGLQLAVVGRRARFNIFFKNASRLNLVVEIIGPNNSKGSYSILDNISALWRYSNDLQDKNATISVEQCNKIPVTCEVVSSQKVSVSYIPVQTGKHRLNVLWEDMHISGSPFTVQVDSSFEDPQSPIDAHESPFSPLCRFESSRKIPLKTKILRKTLKERVLVINGIERPFPTPGFVNLDLHDQNSSKSDSQSDLEEDEVLLAPDLQNKIFNQDIICNYMMNFSSYFPDTLDLPSSPSGGHLSLSNFLDETIDPDAVNKQFEQLVRDETSFYGEETTRNQKAHEDSLDCPPPAKQPCLRERKRTFEERNARPLKIELPPKPKIVPKPDVVQTSVKDRLKFWESLSAANEKETKKVPTIKISRPPKQRKMEELVSSQPSSTTPDSETDSGIVALKSKRTIPMVVGENLPVAMRRSGSFPVVTPQSEQQDCSMSVSNLQRATNNFTGLKTGSRPASGFIDDDYDECLFTGSMATLSESRRSSKDVSRIDLLAGVLRAFGSGLHYATVGLKSNFTVSIWIMQITLNFFRRLILRTARQATSQ